MARGRMLNNSISRSVKFDLLPDDTCRLMATWLISHLDKNGVFYGEPIMVKSLVFPRRADITLEQVEIYLEAMEGVGLITIFEADNQTWQHWPGFTDNQVGLRADRESTSFPAPPIPGRGDKPKPPKPTAPPDSSTPPDTSSNNSGKYPASIRQVSGKMSPQYEVESESKLNTTTEPRMREENKSPTFEDFQRVYETEIGVFSSVITQRFSDYLKECPIQWLIEAVEIAADNNVRKPVYVYGVLDRSLSARQSPRLVGPPTKNGAYPSRASPSPPVAGPSPADQGAAWKARARN